MIVAGAFTGAFSFIATTLACSRRRRSSSSSWPAPRSRSRAVVALPVGIALGHLHRGSSLAIGTSIVGRALPSLVLIGVFLTVLGIGFVNNMAALAVLATGPMLTNAFEGVDRVDRDAVDAARGMGMTGRRSSRVELPLALPLLFTGIRISAVTVVATATIAAVAGGGGLGDIIVNQASYRLSGVLGASICVMALSSGVFLALVAPQRAVTPRGLRATMVPGNPTREGVGVIRKHTRRAAKAAFAISLGVAIVIGLLAAVFAGPPMQGRLPGRRS